MQFLAGLLAAVVVVKTAKVWMPALAVVLLILWIAVVT
jgi:hypothetical protein